MDPSDHVFTLGTLGGHVLTRSLRLTRGGGVDGYDDPDFRGWRVEGEVLILLDGAGETTCRLDEYDRFAQAYVGMDVRGRRLSLRDGTPAWTGLPSRKAFEIVVARHGEPLDWTDLVADNVVVYNKGGDCRQLSTSLPNVGREFNTYLHHIVSRWDELADRTLFVQGSPFEHHLLPFGLYARGDFVANLNSVKRLDDGWISGRSKRAFCERYVQTDVPYQFRHTDGAQFSASRRLIHARGRRYWEDLLALSLQERLVFDDCAVDNYSIGVLFELFWSYILNADGMPTAAPRAIEGTYAGGDTVGHRDTAEYFNQENRAGVHRGQPMRFDW